jgi:hypothetical protein
MERAKMNEHGGQPSPRLTGRNSNHAPTASKVDDASPTQNIAEALAAEKFRDTALRLNPYR